MPQIGLYGERPQMHPSFHSEGKMWNSAEKLAFDWAGALIIVPVTGQSKFRWKVVAGEWLAIFVDRARYINISQISVLIAMENPAAELSFPELF